MSQPRPHPRSSQRLPPFSSSMVSVATGMANYHENRSINQAAKVPRTEVRGLQTRQTGGFQPPGHTRMRRGLSIAAGGRRFSSPCVAFARPWSFPRRRESKAEDTLIIGRNLLGTVLVLYPFEDAKHGSPSVIPAEADLRTTVIPAEAGTQNGGSTLSRPSGNGTSCLRPWV